MFWFWNMIMGIWLIDFVVIFWMVLIVVCVLGLGVL